MKSKPTVEPEDNIDSTSNTIDEKEIDVTEDVMKIMTLNAIFSTPSEDMTLDPTEVKPIIETNKTETHQIKNNPEQDNLGKNTEVENNGISLPFMQQVKQRIRQLEKAEVEHNSPPPTSTKQIKQRGLLDTEEPKAIKMRTKHKVIDFGKYTKQAREKWLKEKYRILSELENWYEKAQNQTPHPKETTDIVWKIRMQNNYLEAMTNITSQRTELACLSYRFTLMSEEEGKPCNHRAGLF